MSRLALPLQRYRYDALDVLVGVEPSGSEKLQRFYRTGHLVTQLDSQGSHGVFQHDRQLLAMQSNQGAGSVSQLLVTDEQRSVLSTIQPAGSLRQVYSPYGHRRVESGIGSLLGFSGEAVDPVTGHYLLGNGHRAFNPVLMRFNSPDRLSPFGKGGLNPYAYCLGDPVNFSDPSGKIANIVRSGFSLINTGMGMSRVIPAYSVAKDALQWGAAGQLPLRQSFTAFSTVIASVSIATAGVAGLGSLIADKLGATEFADDLQTIALVLTALAFVSRVNTYLAARSPKVEAGLKSFVQSRKQPAAKPFNSSDAQPPASPIPSATPYETNLSGKRTHEAMLGIDMNRPILKAKRHRPLVNSNKKIRLG